MIKYYKIMIRKINIIKDEILNKNEIKIGIYYKKNQ